MTYRSIFVHVDDSDQTDLRLDAATRLARHYPAELAGAYIVSTRDFTPTESALLPPEARVQRCGGGDARAAGDHRADRRRLSGRCEGVGDGPAGQDIATGI